MTNSLLSPLPGREFALKLKILYNLYFPHYLLNIEKLFPPLFPFTPEILLDVQLEYKSNK